MNQPSKLLLLLSLTLLPVCAMAQRQGECRDRGAQSTPEQRKKAESDAHLLHVIHENNMSEFESLLDAGADVNARHCVTGTTALMRTVIDDRSEMMQALLSRNADVNARDIQGLTALMLAAGSGRVQMVQALLTAGADVNARTDDNWTALSMALSHASSLEHEEVVRLLKEHGAVD